MGKEKKSAERVRISIAKSRKKKTNIEKNPQRGRMKNALQKALLINRIKVSNLYGIITIRGYFIYFSYFPNIFCQLIVNFLHA